MKPRFMYPNGDPTGNNCVSPDHSKQTISLVVESLNGVSPEDIKRHLSEKWKIVSCWETDRVVVVKETRPGVS